MLSHYDVAIIGYGPTGATLANLLGQHGLSVVVFEREADIYKLPRAVHFDDEVMRIFQSTGICEQLLKTVRINPGMRFVDSSGNLLMDWPRPPEVSSQGWNTSYRFHQPDLESILRKSVNELPNVHVHSGHSVLSVSTHSDHATLQVEDVDGQQLVSTNADFVIGCDGARSTIRALIGEPMQDFGFREKWLVVDVILTRPRPDLGDHSIQHCDAERSATYVRGPGNRRRWEIALKEWDMALDLSDAGTIWQLLSAWISPEDAELERNAVYEFRSRVAKTWSSGRLFLAGDAAHQMPPFMGQGMCAGIRDAANLAWKLAAHIKHGANQKLLDSYASERRSHAEQYVQMSMRLGGLINASKTQEALAAAFPQEDGSTRLESIAPPIGPGIGFDGDKHCGHLSKQLLLANSKMMDDQLGLSPGLIVESSNLLLNHSTFTGEIIDAQTEKAAQEYLAELGVVAVLVRPDRYIFGVATNSTELDNLITSWSETVS
ncbi:MAG: bifunctional 3-(3-hydroxy-phenyl)propionate/3-hydroxycinnamic acid hydroxylase [Rhizobiaceae bacterium]|nr:bifunctional 3-(3-hydroxy-phenyl)propionate/3-hydroxycinnamic acid hydroxylase [Rhizobiaceae bacterium]